MLDRWARESGAVRLELTAECANQAALGLDRQIGFETEGFREKFMPVCGEDRDEYYMAKLRKDSGR